MDWAHLILANNSLRAIFLLVAWSCHLPAWQGFKSALWYRSMQCLPMVQHLLVSVCRPPVIWVSAAMAASGR